MENRRALAVVSVKADTEEQLQAKLFELSLETAKAPDVITIYPRGSKVVAWVKVETKHIEVTTSASKKKVTKKKAKKKVS